MRLADIILRRGHLSERTLVDICMTGERPAHLDRCDVCAERADALGRWLDDVRSVGLEEAAEAFPAERLAAQQSQILRRLEQIDRPARVIAFPGQSRDDRLGMAPQGIRPAWIGVAAAAGIVLGLVGGQVTARLTTRSATPDQTQQTASSTASVIPSTDYELMPIDLDESDRPQVEAVAALDAMMPHSVTVSGHVLHTTRLKK